MPIGKGMKRKDVIGKMYDGPLHCRTFADPWTPDQENKDRYGVLGLAEIIDYKRGKTGEADRLKIKFLVGGDEVWVYGFKKYIKSMDNKKYKNIVGRSEKLVDRLHEKHSSIDNYIKELRKEQKELKATIKITRSFLKEVK